MKAILVIDMPTCCEDCPCLQQDDIICRALNEELFVNRDEEPIKSARCPLKPLPEPKYAKATDTDLYWGKCFGWNACLEEIEK